MSINSNVKILRVLKGICDLTLPKHEWTHEAHFAAAIAMFSDAKFHAFNDMPGIIKAYNEATGVQNTNSAGYHHTITIASLLATKHIMAKAGDQSMVDTLSIIMSAEYGSPNWLLSYWSDGVLFSPTARRSWIVPDVKAPQFSLSFN